MPTTPQDDANSQPGEVRSSAQLGLGPERLEMAPNQMRALLSLLASEVRELRKEKATWFEDFRTQNKCIADQHDEIARLRALAEHLRNCRECGETDVANCAEGEPLWDACMPQPAAEIGGA